ncbi:LpqB family beta-propeller domain-containing protein [Streptomyces sp. Ru73]|uniref:LpqB family beta-propeller domain-containing protein n=1 Tax=Streptomyces sp. Ru73 TaxID=2080748 RepID=UPI00215629EA|nr:LpqB family beta-propeller domain-containing protein [Streptomyces sp. Ru73]
MTGAERKHGGARGGRPRAARLRTVAVLAAGALLLAGCASMPDSGESLAVDQASRADADSQVRVYGVPPQEGAQPTDIVRGFLDALTSDEANLRTAKQYLAASARKTWQPFATTKVLQERPKATPEGSPANREDARSFTVSLVGTQVATVDRKHAYTPEERAYRETMHLTRENGQWRIDRLPNGLVLGLPDFQRIYQPVNKYYFASYKSEAGEPRAGKDVLVADPVYLRQRIDPVTASVNSLLQGPTNWLDKVALSAFPKGTRVTRPTLTLDDSNALRVRLSKQANGVETNQCRRMAAQVLFTVQGMARASKVSEVELQDDGGDSLCKLSQEEAADRFGQQARMRHTALEYYIDGDHRVVSMTDSVTGATPVPGPLGSGKIALRSVGVAHGEETAAGVSLNGRALYVADLDEKTDRAEVRLRSKAKNETDGLTAPSWDGLGDLWVADRDGDGSRLLRLRSGKGEPQEVAMPGLGKRRIKAIRVASDGIRIAMLVEDKGRTTLQLGRVERGGTAMNPKLSVEALRPIAPQLEDVVAASWAGDSRLVVVGRESGGVQQMQFMETDGSASNTQTLPGVNGVKSVAASEDESRPLIADADEGIVRLPADANWKTVATSGTAPVYPG